MTNVRSSSDWILELAEIWHVFVKIKYEVLLSLSLYDASYREIRRLFKPST